MGGIVIEQREPFYVEHEGSTVVVFNIEETDDTRGAAANLAELVSPSVPAVIVVDYRFASVHVIPKDKL